MLRYTLIVATAYLLLVEARFEIPSLLTCLMIAAALASNVGIGMLPSRASSSKLATAAIVLADTAWVTIALLASGRFNADFFFLYFFILLLATMGESLAPAFYGHLIERMRREQRRATAAQALVQTRTELLTTVSHEIRNPVNGLLGWSDLLLETELTTDQHKYVEGIQRAGQSLAAILNDVLDIAKIEAGKLTFERVAFSVATAIEDGKALIAGVAQRKGLRLGCRVDPDLPPVLVGDPLRLRQVLNNLLSNAVKFTAEGEIVVRAGVESRGATSVVLRIEVTDTGVGIPPAQQGYIFNAFEQADSGTARHYGGTGLGLAISKRLVQAMNGTIGVVSRVGEGSTFWFTARFRLAPASDTVAILEAGSSTPIASMRNDAASVA